MSLLIIVSKWLPFVVATIRIGTNSCHPIGLNAFHFVGCEATTKLCKLFRFAESYLFPVRAGYAAVLIMIHQDVFVL